MGSLPQTILRVLNGSAEVPVCRLIWGSQMAPFTVGSHADWIVRAPGVEGIHFFLAFDGQQLFASRVASAAAVWLNGVPVAQTWTLVPASSELRFGEALVSIACEEGVSEPDQPAARQAPASAPIRPSPTLDPRPVPPAPPIKPRPTLSPRPGQSPTASRPPPEAGAARSEPSPGIHPFSGHPAYPAPTQRSSQLPTSGGHAEGGGASAAGDSPPTGQPPPPLGRGFAPVTPVSRVFHSRPAAFARPQQDAAGPGGTPPLSNGVQVEQGGSPADVGPAGVEPYGGRGGLPRTMLEADPLNAGPRLPLGGQHGLGSGQPTIMEQELSGGGFGFATVSDEGALMKFMGQGPGAGGPQFPMGPITPRTGGSAAPTLVTQDVARSGGATGGLPALPEVPRYSPDALFPEDWRLSNPSSSAEQSDDPGLRARLVNAWRKVFLAKRILLVLLLLGAAAAVAWMVASALIAEPTEKAEGSEAAEGRAPSLHPDRTRDPGPAQARPGR